MPSNARLILGLVSLALIKKATCGQISPFCNGGLPGPARDCSPLIPGFCESAGKNLLPRGKRVESCTQETSAGEGTGDFGFSCHIFVENTVATAHIPSVQLCEEVLLTINNTCERANGGQAQAMGDSFVYNYYSQPGGCA